MNHRRRDRAARRDGAPARGRHHHGRAGAPGLLSPRWRRSPRPRPRSSPAWCQAAAPCCRATTRIFPCCASAPPPIGAQIVTFGYHEEADFRAPAGRSRPQGLLRHRRPRLAALPLPRRRARRALREELAGRAGRARRARRRRHALPAGAGARRRPRRPRRAHAARCAGRADPADRRELQRQSGLGAGGAGRHGHRPRARPSRAASPCWATCWSWARRRRSLHRGAQGSG